MATAAPLPPPQTLYLGVLGKGSAWDMAWSPDGNMLAVGSSAEGFIYDTHTWQLLQTIPVNTLETKGVRALTFSEDGNSVLFSQRTGKTPPLRYDLKSNTISSLFENKTFESNQPPVFAHDGKSFASTNYVCDKNSGGACHFTLKLHDTTTGSLLYQLLDDVATKNNGIQSIVFSTDDKILAAGNGENLVRVWDISGSKLLYELRHDSGISDLAFHPNNAVLASASQDATVRFWDAQTGKNIFVLRGFTKAIQHIAFVQGGKNLLVGLHDGTFLEWLLDEKGLPAQKLNTALNPGAQLGEYGFEPIQTTMKISPDTTQMAILVNSNIQIWDLKAGKRVLTIPEFNGKITAMALSPDSNLLAVGDNNLHLWQVKPKKYVATLEINSHSITNIAFRPQTQQVAVLTEGGAVQIWDISGLQSVLQIKTTLDWNNSSLIAFSPDGNQLATAGWGDVRIWNATSGRLLQKFAVGGGEPCGLSFGPDGKQLIFVGERELWRWDISTGKALYTVQLPDHNIWSAAFSSERMVFGKGNAGPFMFFDPLTGQHLYDFAEGRGGNRVALSPEGRLLARSDYRKILLADGISGKALLSLDFDLTYFLSISSDGRLLLASSYENTTHVWDISALTRQAGSMPPETATPKPTLSPTPTVTPLPVKPLVVQPQTLPSPQPGAITAANAANLQPLGTIGLGHAETVVWSPDGKLLAIGGKPGIYIFATGASKPAHFLPTDGMVLTMAFSSDGKRLAGQIELSTAEVWDVPSGRSLYKLSLDGASCLFKHLTFSSDGQTLSSSDCTGMTSTWSAADGQLLRKEHSQNEDGNLHPESLTVERETKRARLLDTSNGQILKTFEYPDRIPVGTLFSPDGKTLLIWFTPYEVGHSGVYIPASNGETFAQLWNIPPGEDPTLKATIQPGKWYRNLEDYFDFQAAWFTPDSRRLVTASGDGQVQLWDTASGQILHTLPGRDPFLSPDGQHLVSLQGNGLLRGWDIAPGQDPVNTWTIEGFSDSLSFLQFTTQEKELISGSNNGLRVWSQEQGILPTDYNLIEFPGGAVDAISASPDGRLLAYSRSGKLILGKNNSQDQQWHLLNQTAKPLPYYYTVTLTFSLDSRLFASSDPDKLVRVWYLDQATHIELAPDLYPQNLLFSPDGKLLLISGSRTTIELWDTQTGERVRQWDVLGSCAAFHPNGTILVSANYETGALRFWDIQSGKLLRIAQGSPEVKNMAFSPDGSLLVITSYSGMEFWDVATGHLLRKVDNAQNPQASNYDHPAFSPDGKILVVSTSGGRIQYWGLPKEQ